TRHGLAPGVFELLDADLLPALWCQPGVHPGDVPGEQGADGILSVLPPGRPRLRLGGPAGVSARQDQPCRLLEPGGIGGAAAVAEQGGDGPALAVVNHDATAEAAGPAGVPAHVPVVDDPRERLP